MSVLIHQLICQLYIIYLVVVVQQGRAADLSYIESVARMIADIAQTSKIVVEKSTVPVKAAESVSTILRTNHNKGVEYQVSSDWKFGIRNSLVLLIRAFVTSASVSFTASLLIYFCNDFAQIIVMQTI